jgi:hypothetical protein
MSRALGGYCAAVSENTTTNGGGNDDDNGQALYRAEVKKVIEKDVARMMVKVTAKKKEEKRRKRQIDAMVARSHEIKRDFITSVRDDFARPFICRYPHCGQGFSRQYTLKVHEKSHELFQRYHDYKRRPQLFLDADSAEVARENEARINARTSLPPLVQKELASLVFKMPGTLHTTTTSTI